MKELVSLIVPVYNVEKYLSKCIDSIIEQSYTNIEIILINDGSTDNSGKICDEYSNKDKRIRVIHNKNTGVSSSRNIGLKISKGKYVGFVDSDDYIDKDMIKILMQNLQKNKADISICGYKIFYENSKKIKISDNKKETIKLNKQEVLEIIFNSNKINGFLWNKIFKKDIFKNEFLNEKIDLCEDLLMICKLVEKSSIICYTSKPLYNYRNNFNNTTTNIKKIFSESGICRYRYAYEILEKEFNNNNTILNLVKLRYIKTLMESYYLAIKMKSTNININNYTTEYLKKNWKLYLGNRETSKKQKLIFIVIFIICKINKYNNCFENKKNSNKF